MNGAAATGKGAAEEFAERTRRAQAAMRARGLDALFAYSRTRGHVRYLSGYFPGYLTNWAVLALPQRGDPSLFVRFDFDVERARAMVGFAQVRPASELLVVDPGARRVGVVARDLAVDEGTPEVWAMARRSYPDAELLDASDLVLDLRSCKSEFELARIDRATRIAQCAASAMLHSIRPGVSDWELVAAAESAARCRGAERILVLIAVDADGVVTEPRGARWNEGDPVQTEITLSAQGYWTQVNRTFHGKGVLRGICQAAAEAGRRAARPGSGVQDVVRAVRRNLTSALAPGSRVEYDFGHGVGCDCPEWPRLIAGGEDAPLREDMVVVVHAGARAPGEDAAFWGGPLQPRPDGGRWLGEEA